MPSSASLAAEISYSAARGKSGGGFKSLSGTVTGTLAYVPGTFPGSMPELTIGSTSSATGSKGQVFLKNVQIVPITSLVKASTGSFDLVDARNRHVASVTLTGLPDPGAIPDPFPAGSYALLDKFAFRATVPAGGKGHKSSLVQGTVDLSLPQGLPAQDSSVPVMLGFQTSKHGH